MKSSFTVLFATAFLCGCQAADAADKPAAPKQLEIRVAVFEGDPKGSREAGTIKAVAEPTVVTVENREFWFNSGGEIPYLDGDQVDFIKFGLMAKGKPGFVKDSKVQLDLTLSISTPVEQSENRIQVQTESTRTISTVRLGEVLKLQWPKGGSDKQAWCELSVKEIKSEHDAMPK